MRQRGRFAGFSLYVSNTTDQHRGYMCYKDGPELPPLDFNITCITHGRFVIFYNEKLPGTIYPMGYETSVVFTELCEVTVTGCSSSGVFGVNCDKLCPENCQEWRCNIINGTCLGCTLGWLGAQCDEACPVGYYGLQCESKCVGHCKDSVGCNRTSGLCDNGCDDGWTGSNCTKECPLGSYGPDCVHKCSGRCLGDVACNRTTGKCDTGCESGYTGEMCETDCEMGTFGKGCSYRCSGHCLDNVSCNPTTGHCDSGCASGYVEPFCNKSCEMGTFGKSCSNKCSGQCLENVPCNSTTGHCDSGCASGYVQPYCNTTDLKITAFGEGCNDPSYIAALLVVVFVTFVSGSVCILFMWKYYRLVKKVRSLQYASIIRASTQDNNANNCQQYEELRISDSRYHNIELRN
ncbi:multiple epidermal growth factor-like domains protein 10 isoform X2 [Magallana gigas]|uniref:multiple epidermal growth factor-like domains protein 10 isoform X2 n=1 Tax=Magallana gigas TaxID=29159 RepID=UPI00333F0366